MAFRKKLLEGNQRHSERSRSSGSYVGVVGEDIDFVSCEMPRHKATDSTQGDEPDIRMESSSDREMLMLEYARACEALAQPEAGESEKNCGV